MASLPQDLGIHTGANIARRSAILPGFTPADFPTCTDTLEIYAFVSVSSKNVSNFKSPYPMADNLLSPRVNECRFRTRTAHGSSENIFDASLFSFQAACKIYRVSDLCDKQASAALQVPRALQDSD